MDQHLVTLDDYGHRPLIRRTEKFIQLCEFYKSVKGRYPESSFLVFDFIHDTVLPFELRHFKMLSQGQITAAFWKWKRITGNNCKTFI